MFGIEYAGTGQFLKHILGVKNSDRVPVYGAFTKLIPNVCVFSCTNLHVLRLGYRSREFLSCSNVYRGPLCS